MATNTKRLALFGDSRPWKSSEWTAQDDRVRGGSSVSYFIPASDGETAILNGTLDTRTLGGAGFASQRTTEERVWDLSPYEGIEIVVQRGGSDERTNKVFALVLKDSVPPSYIDEATGRKREDSTISYEVTFKPLIKGDKPEERIYLPFTGLKATYRGRDREDAPPINLANIRRFSLMVRSFFGNQSGPFQITLISISAVTAPVGKGRRALRRQDPDGFYDEYDEFDNDYDDHDMSADGDKPKVTGARSSWGCRIL